MLEQKVFSFAKSYPDQVGTQTVYTQDPVYTGYLKKGRKLSELDSVQPMKKTNKVQIAKKKDVEKLMAFFKVPDNAQEFYEDVLAATDKKGPDIEPDLYEDQETFL